jgi:hypothetical protein
MLATSIDPALQHRLPAFRCVHDPLTTDLNKVLLKRYSLVKATLLNQSQVSEELLRHIDAEALALVLVDGLSYADLANNMELDGAFEEARINTGRNNSSVASVRYNLSPVLVDGLSITEQGMTRIVGHPPLAFRVLAAPFNTCLGFTYWERSQEPLTDRLFAGFGDRVWKVKDFNEVLGALEEKDLRSSFVQIVRMGLDGVAHRQRDRPNTAALIADVLADFDRLVRLYAREGVHARLYLTSDHGILWAHEHKFEHYELTGSAHPRYYEHAKQGEHLLTFASDGHEFTLLEYPYLRRELKSNEWGVHGGLSFQESIVPLLLATVTFGNKEPRHNG